MFIDSHCHLSRFPNPTETISSAKSSGAIALISCGFDNEANAGSLEIAKANHKFVFPVIGLAPTTVMDMREEEFNAQFEFVKANAKNAAAIGEIGLDNHWPKNHEQVEKQKVFFMQQLEFAMDEKLPVVIHSRKAEGEAIKILEDAGAEKVLLHYFSGTSAEAKLASELNYRFTLPPVSSSSRAKMLAEIPDELLMLESDSPYVGKTPNSVLDGAGILARAKGLSIEDALNITSKNAIRFYDLKL